MENINQSPIDAVGQIEQNDLEPITLKHRHGFPKELFGMWVGANTNYVVMLEGVLMISLGLSFLQSIMAILVGNLLGCTVLGLAAIMGPRTGTAGIVTSRTSFGHLGAYLPTIISTVSVLGWFSINSVVATMGLQELFKLIGIPDSTTLMWICMGIVLLAETLLAIYGHATIVKVEQWIAIILAAMFLGMFCFMLPNMDWNFAGTLAPGEGSAGWGTWLLGMGIIFSYPISWTNFSSDYSRYLKPDVSWKKVAFFSGGGQFTALMLTEIVGVCVGIVAIKTLGGLAGDPVSQLPQLLPTWFFAIFMLAVVLGCVATNVPNGYTAGLSLLALRLPLKRVQGILVIAAATLIFRIVTLIYGQFFELYEQWLLYIIIWTCPWITIVLTDYFLRKGNYDSVEIMNWGKGSYWYNSGIFWPGIISFVVAMAVSLLFTNSNLYASPLMINYFGGADLSYFAGVITAGVLYYTLVKNHPTYAAARAMKTSRFSEEA